MTLGLRLKQLRERFAFKQLDLANSLHVSPQAVSKWERDENLPDLFLLKKIAILFDVSIDYLVGMYDEERDVFEATVFCSSINCFAEKGIELSAKELAQWTNVLFHHMTDIVLRYGGIPIKYTGDGFLCFFSGVNHASRALKAVEDIDRIHIKEDIIMILHSGDVYVGRVGHPDYSSTDIYGHTVNSAFLMMDSVAKIIKKGVGITEHVKEQVEHKQLVKLTDVTLSQRKEPITVYQLKGVK